MDMATGHIQNSEPSIELVRMAGHNGSNQVHLYELIKHEAETYDAKFTQEGVDKVTKAVQRGDVVVLFLKVGNEIAGGTILFPSVDIQFKNASTFLYRPAVHCEDMGVFKEFGGMGYGKKFLDAVIRHVNSTRTLNSQNAAIVGEHSKHTVPMTKMFNRLQTTLAPEDDTILQFNNPIKLPEDRNSDVTIRLKIDNLGYVARGSSKINLRPNVFVLSWPPNRGRRIVATFTRGISSFSGDPVIRVQLASNQSFPPTEQLADVVGTILQKGAQIAKARGWTEDKDPVSLLRINAIGESDIRRVLKLLGAEDHKLGVHNTHAHIIGFQNLGKIIQGVNPNTPSLVLTENGLSGTSTQLEQTYTSKPAQRPEDRAVNELAGKGASVSNGNGGATSRAAFAPQFK